MVIRMLERLASFQRASELSKITNEAGLRREHDILPPGFVRPLRLTHVHAHRRADWTQGGAYSTVGADDLERSMIS